jgi:hypothetical protein
MSTDQIRYVATINVPGYLPMDDNPPVFDNAEDAWQYLVSEVEQEWDEYPEDENGACIEAHTQFHVIDQSQCGTVYAPTPGYDGDHDLGLAHSVSIAEDWMGQDA